MEWQLLEMLAAEVPPEAFVALLNEARSADASPEGVEDLERKLNLALNLVARRAQQAQRERELAALYETAVDLTAIRDLQPVLDGIVRRGRQLLHSDAAYLMLNEGVSGRTYMRAAHGTVSPGFADIRLDFGRGLGGVVAQGGRPFYTSDYLSDARLDHSGTVDGIVKEEGLLAILGVPLHVGGEVTGVLFAADRRERHYRPEEVQLLSSLAAHAAVAIENARLFEELQRVVAELHEANARAREHSEYVEWSAAAHARFTGVVAGGGRLQDLAEAAREVLNARLLVLGHDLRLLTDDPQGATDRGRPGAVAPPEVLAAIKRTTATGRTEYVTGDDGLVWSAAPILAAGSTIGTVLVSRPAPFSPLEQRTLERVAQTTGLLLLQQKAVAEAEHRVRGELLSEILAGRPEAMEVVRDRATMVGLDVDRPHVVVVSAIEGADRYATGRLVTEFASGEAGLGGYVAEVERLVAILPKSHRDGDESRRLLATLRELTDGILTTAVSEACFGLSGIAEAYKETGRCVSALLALGRGGTTAGVTELRFYSLLLNNAEQPHLRSFVQGALGPLISYDATHGTALVDTLATYLDRHLSVARSASALGIHTNTLYKRLDRIGHLLGGGWDSPERSLQLQLALRLHTLSRQDSESDPRPVVDPTTRA